HEGVPMWVADGVHGVITVFLNGPRHSRKREEEELLSAVAQVLAATIERKRAEEALRRSEERFDLAVRGSDAGIWDRDLRTDTVYFSPRWKSMLGYADDEIPNAFSSWESRLHPDDRERALATLRDYREARSPEYELEHLVCYPKVGPRGMRVQDGPGRARKDETVKTKTYTPE